MSDYANHNAKNVLDRVNEYIAEKDARTVPSIYKNWRQYTSEHPKRYYEGAGYDISEVFDDLSIFDWWTDHLSVTKLKQMKSFLNTAIELGYDGYVCFKVGASGCSNGMWAHKNESTDGHSPDGECLYRSFTPDYTYWQVKDAEGKWFPETKVVKEKLGEYTYISHEGYDSCKTISGIKKLIASL